MPGIARRVLGGLNKQWEILDHVRKEVILPLERASGTDWSRTLWKNTCSAFVMQGVQNPTQPKTKPKKRRKKRKGKGKGKNERKIAE